MKALFLFFCLTASMSLSQNENVDERWFFNKTWAQDLKENFEQQRRSTQNLRDYPSKVVDIVRDNIIIFFAMDNNSKESYMQRILRSCRENHNMTRLEAQKIMNLVQAMNVGTNQEIVSALNQFADAATSRHMEYLVAETGLGSHELPPIQSPSDFEDFANALGDAAMITAQVIGGVISIGLTVVGSTIATALGIAEFGIGVALGAVDLVISLGIMAAGLVISTAIFGMKEAVKAVGKGVQKGAEAIGKAVVKIGKAIGKLFKGKKGKKKGFMPGPDGNGDCCGIPILLSY